MTDINVINEALSSAQHGYVDEAIFKLNGFLIDNPSHRLARIERGRLFFKKGIFDKGIDDFEYFYQGVIPSVIDVFHFDTFHPSLLDNKIVIITSDSGIGDLIQFVRYGLILKSLGATVIIECDSMFHDFLNMINWIDYCILPGHINFNYSYRIPLHYLPGSFRTTVNNIPSFYSYLNSSITEPNYSSTVDPNKLNIGISWRSTNENSSMWTVGRNLDLYELISTIDTNLFNIILLQRGINDLEMKILSDLPNIVFPSLHTLTDTANVISQCDLVVSSCTMIPHLSGSLGIPTFILLSTNSCWRWLMHRSDSPWYPSVRLIRQTSFNDWSVPMNLLIFELRKFSLSLNGGFKHEVQL